MSGYLIQRSNKRGYLLIEALLATIILSVSITMIIQSMVASLRVTTYSSQYTIALNLLENKMSEILLDASDKENLNKTGNFPEPYQQYQYSLRSDIPQGENSGDIKEVKLKVFWESGKRRNNIELITYLFDESE